jgi:hypothetical protein
VSKIIWQDSGMSEIAEELKRRLSSLQPLISWPKALSAADLVIEEVWRQKEPDEWPMLGPPEDYALPPLVHWSDDLHRLAESAYRETFGEYLEPGDRYILEWPPRGSLWTDGAWGYSEVPQCSGHGAERSSDCTECHDLTDEIVQVVHASAVWSWQITVHHVFAGEAEVEEADDWDLGVTEVDPWTVDYSTYDDGAHGAHLVAAVGWTVEEAAANQQATADASGVDQIG